MPIITDSAWWIAGVLAFAGGLLLTPLVIRVARRKGWVAHPSEERWHAQPTALMGGIAIYMAATFALALVSIDPSLWIIWGGSTIMFITGLVDDLKGLKPAAKLIGQVIAAVLLLYAGYTLGGGALPFWIAVPLTFFWLIGITNALNLLDNMDGLAAGITVIAALVLAIFSALIGEQTVAIAMVAVAGAAAAFTVYNFKPAKIFMGDCGSLFLGYTIAAFALVMQSTLSRPDNYTVYLVSIAVLAVPIFDTTLVTVLRSFAGRSIAQGGCDHSSHRLVLLGLSERQAVLTLYLISILFGSLALFFQFSGEKLFVALLIFMFVALVVFGVYLAHADVYREEGDRVLAAQLSVRSRFFLAVHALLGRNWKAVGGVIVDLLLMVAAFILAYFLRFEEGVTPEREAFLMQALPIVIVVKLPLFYSFRLYQAIWRHAGTPEIVRIIKATLLASLLTYVVLGLIFGFPQVAKGVIVIDWMIMTIAITGARFGFRGLRQYVSTKRQGGRRTLLYGAGDTGLMALRILLQKTSLRLKPVGFVDDNSLNHGLIFHGLRVLGDADDLPRLCKEHAVDEVLITLDDVSALDRQKIIRTCQKADVACRVFEVNLELLLLDQEVERVAFEERPIYQ